jgi:MauM/NapG family ferredoxin protein
MYKTYWIKLRALIQILFWFLFFFMLINTRFPIKNNAHAFSLFQRLSIHLGIVTSLTSRSFVLEFLPSLVVIFLIIIFGRFFCGWICPLGSTIDIADKIYKSNKKTFIKFDKKNLKYILLVISIMFSIVGLHLGGLFDPLSLVFRIYTVILYPILDFALKGFFDILYKIPIINSLSEPIYDFLTENFLDYNNISFNNFLAVLSIIIFLLILSKLTRRFWCRYICPLGAIYALTAKFSFFKRIVNKNNCTSCLKCVKNCRMKAIYNNGMNTLEGECIKCFDCLLECKYDAIRFKFSLNNFLNIKHNLSLPNMLKTEKNDIRLTRKHFLTGIFSSILLMPIFKFNNDKSMFTKIIRPPGALPEKEFLEKCLKCGQCMKACPTNGLHPVLLEAGIQSIFSPQLIPRRGHCEFNCNLCSRVCPSHAIKQYDIKDKEKMKIGTAYIIKDLCFPWSEDKNCLVCEEMCPVSTKAIKLKERDVINSDGKKVKVLLPHVITELCIGCGICENKCPVNGSAAIRVRIRKDQV